MDIKSDKVSFRETDTVSSETTEDNPVDTYDNATTTDDKTSKMDNLPDVPLHVNIVAINASRHVVTNEISRHVHVTSTTQIHKPKIRNFLKRVIRRFTNMEQSLGAYIVSNGLCVLNACQISAWSP